MKKITPYLIVVPVLAALSHALISLSATPPTHVQNTTRDTPASLVTNDSPVQVEQQRAAPLFRDDIKQALQNTSLADTLPPAIPTLNSEGKLQRNRELRDIFDYFLSLSGEQRDEEIQQRIEAYLTQHLPAHAVAEAMSLLAQYQRLNQRLTDLAQTLEGDDLQTKLQHLMTLRRELLGEELATTFFGEEEAYDRYSLELLASDANTVNAVESLPEGLRDRQRERLQQQHLLEGTQRLEAAGASVAELYQFHLLNGNAAIAERYQTLASQREQWQHRFTAFRVQRDNITQLPLSSEEKTHRINQLLADSFNETEIVRVKALENMESH